jgi:hypothetical protein
MSHTNGKQLAEAVRLSRPGSVLTPDEIKVIIAAADTIEAGGGPTSKDEDRVALSASRLRLYGPANPPPPAIPPPLLQRVAEAAAVRQAKDLLAGKALEDVVVARRAVFGAKTPDEMARLTEAAMNAERAWADARHDVDRAQSRLCDAQTAVAEFQREQLARTP